MSQSMEIRMFIASAEVGAQDRVAIHVIADLLRKMVKGDVNAALAFALVGAELSEENGA